MTTAFMRGDSLVRRRAILLASGAATAAGFLPQPAIAATWPTRPVRLIVPYAAGNITDQLARVLTENFSARWGQRVIVENMPGAGGTLGAAAVARSVPDGHTLGLIAMAAMAIVPHMMRQPPYDPLRDFAPISAVAVSRSVLVVHPSVMARSVAELVEVARRGGQPLFYYSSGSGTVPHLNMEALRRELDFPAEHVPYRGAAAGLADLRAGRVHMTFEAVNVVLPQVQEGGLRALAYNGPRRHPLLPDVPTLEEAAPGVALANPWLSLFGPPGLPPEIASRVADAARAAVTERAFVARAPMGLDLVEGAPEELAGRLLEDHTRFGRLVAELGLQID